MKEETRAVPFAEHVWNTLSRIDVADHVDTIEATKKRPAVQYLSWSRAWTLLKRKFPASTYAHRADLHHTDGTVEVEVDVVISFDGTADMFTNAKLAVMDFYFGAIVNPNAREINDARQRALVKALAFAGLGLNLWSDSLIPVGALDDPISLKQVEKINKLIEDTSTDLDSFLQWARAEIVADIPYERYNSAVTLLESRKRIQDAEKAKEDKS